MDIICRKLPVVPQNESFCVRAICQKRKASFSSSSEDEEKEVSFLEKPRKISSYPEKVDHDLDFSDLMDKHVRALSNKISAGFELDISDIFMAVYNVKLLETPHIYYSIEINPEIKGTIRFSNNTVFINPQPITDFYLYFKEYKVLFLAYLGLLIHYYVIVETMNHSKPYSLKLGVFSKPYSTLFKELTEIIRGTTRN